MFFLFFFTTFTTIHNWLYVARLQMSCGQQIFNYTVMYEASLSLCFLQQNLYWFVTARIYRLAVVVIYKCLIIEHVIIRLYLSESLVMVYQSTVCWQQRINSTVCLITISVCCHHVNTDRLQHSVLDLCGYSLVWGNFL